MKEHFLREVEKRLEDYPFPPQIVLETTAFCNQKCIHCAHKTMMRKKGNMDMSLFKKIIEEIADKDRDAEVWMTFYGEALLLRYKLHYMIEYAKKRGLEYVILNTNAMLLNSEMGHMLIDSGLDRLIFSVDGFTKETYEKIRVRGDRDVVFGNIVNFVELMRRRRAKRPMVEVQYSVMEENEHEVEDFKKFWFERGVNIKIREKLTWTGSVEANNLKAGIPRIACPWAMRACGILWTGDMVGCAVDYEGGFIAGNVTNSSIEEVWRGRHRDFRKIHIEHRFDELPRICSTCLDWQAVGAKDINGRTQNAKTWKELLE